jgi:glycosyltransferase involved in cell wall biosynthesis
VRIWFVHHYAVTPDSPGGTRHFGLARRLATLGHQVQVIAASYHYQSQRETRDFGPDAEQVESIDGVEFIWVRTTGYSGNGVGRFLNLASFARRALRSRALARLGRPDVVLGSSPQPLAAWAALRLARRYGARFVYEVRDLWPDTLVELGRVPRWHPVVRLFGRIERDCCRAADAVVTLLPGSADHLVARGAPRERIVWVPNGVDLSSIGTPGAANGGGPCLFLYAGAIGLANGLDVVVRAAAEAGSPVRLRIVGDGPELPALKALAAALGAANVEFAGLVPKREMPRVLAEADAFVMVLKDSPVFRWGISPNKLFDYLAAGRPVLFAVNTPVNPVADADAGFAANPNSAQEIAAAMKRIAALSPSERREMGARGRAYVERHHDVNVLADRFAAALTGTGV